MHNVIKKIYPIKEEIIEFEYRDEDIDSPIEQLLYGTEERK
jgi:hypothetical protein